LRDISSVALPSAVSYVSSILVEVINVAFVGHLGDPALVAGVGLGNMYLNTTALAVMIGLNNGLSTFVS